jgi:hypothetical protein
MPYKHCENRRHKFTKPKYKVTNWPEYNDALRRRGDLTIWFTEAAINQWRPAKTGARGPTTGVFRSRHGDGHFDSPSVSSAAAPD